MSYKPLRFDSTINKTVQGEPVVEASEVHTAPTYNGIPRANAEGKIDVGWLPDEVTGGSGGSGVIAGTNVWSVDTPPSVPTAQDDEFGGPSLDPKWQLHVNYAGLDVSVRQHALHIKATANSGIFSGAVQSLPSDNATYVAPIAVNSTFSSSNSGGGMVIVRADGYKVTFALLDGPNIDISYWNGPGSYGGSITRRQSIGAYGEQVFLAIRKTGTTYDFMVSADGVGWITHYSGTFADMAYIGFGIYTNASEATLTVPWFRRIALDQLGGIVGGVSERVYSSPADIAPSSPTTYDDEFSGSSLNAKWSVFANAGSVTRSVGSSYYRQAAGVNVGFAGMFQAISGDFVVTAKIGVGGFRAADLFGALYVGQGAVGSNVAHLCGLQWGTVNGVEASRLNADGTLHTRLASIPLNVSSLYLRVVHAAGTLKSYYSTDGLAWLGISAYAPGWTPTVFGLVHGCNNGEPSDLTAQWVRVG